MFSLENSQKHEYRVNNWKIVENFIKKNEIEIKEINYAPIVEGDKSKLLEFIIVMYETLTRKKLGFKIGW